MPARAARRRSGPTAPSAWLAVVPSIRPFFAANPPSKDAAVERRAGTRRSQSAQRTRQRTPQTRRPSPWRRREPQGGSIRTAFRRPPGRRPVVLSTANITSTLLHTSLLTHHVYINFVDGFDGRRDSFVSCVVVVVVPVFAADDDEGIRGTESGGPFSASPRPRLLMTRRTRTAASHIGRIVEKAMRGKPRQKRESDRSVASAARPSAAQPASRRHRKTNKNGKYSRKARTGTTVKNGR